VFHRHRDRWFKPLPVILTVTSGRGDRTRATPLRVFNVFGELRQNGYVVPDLDDALDHWIKVLGVGPWMVFEHVPVTNFAHRGGVEGTVDMTIALTQYGNAQVELIVQHDDTPSTYREFLDRHPHGGLHHLGFWPDDMDAALAYATERGLQVVTGGQIGDDGRFRYYEPVPAMSGAMLELAEVQGRRRTWFEQLAVSSRDWDGTNPVVRR
jgi:catechol 2,3-dioxygenase-like lactoylglutathione lyase family enzyme